MVLDDSPLPPIHGSTATYVDTLCQGGGCTRKDYDTVDQFLEEMGEEIKEYDTYVTRQVPYANKNMRSVHHLKDTDMYVVVTNVTLREKQLLLRYGRKPNKR